MASREQEAQRDSECSVPTRVPAARGTPRPPATRLGQFTTNADQKGWQQKATRAPVKTWHPNGTPGLELEYRLA